MPRFNVKLPDGRWQVFSTVVDDFVTGPMTFEELREFRREQAVREADAETDSLLTSIPRINVMSYDEALETIKLMHDGDDDA